MVGKKFLNLLEAIVVVCGIKKQFERVSVNTYSVLKINFIVVVKAGTSMQFFSESAIAD